MTATNQPPLPCSCIRGDYLCPEARRLWANIESAYTVAQDNSDWRIYDIERSLYYAHYEHREEEVCYNGIKEANQ